jgi:hypothetical protein
MSTLDDIRANLRSRALVAGVDPLPSGHIRIETTFRYPDGGSIELFVVDPPRLLSDLGQTTAWLLDMQIKPWLSKKRQAMVEDVLHVHGVRQNGGAIEIDLPSLDELETKVLVLAQVCLRLADLTFTRRASLQAAFSDDLAEVLADADLEYEPNVELPGRFGSKVRVDSSSTALAGRPSWAGPPAALRRRTSWRTRSSASGTTSTSPGGTTAASRCSTTATTSTAPRTSSGSATSPTSCRCRTRRPSATRSPPEVAGDRTCDLRAEACA